MRETALATIVGYIVIMVITLPVLLFLFLVVLPVGVLAIRTASILVVVILQPVNSLRALPANWYRVVFAMDSAHPPELVPGLETHPSRAEWEFLRNWRFSAFWSDLPGNFRRDPWSLWLAGPILVLFGVLLYAPAILYRFSLKSTSLIYLPFLWVIRDSLSEEFTLRQRLQGLKESEAERLKRWYSGFVIIFLTVLPLVLFFTLYPRLLDLLGWLDPSTHPRIARLMTIFVFATPYRIEVEGWHVARVVNAALTLVLFYYADSTLRRLSFGKPEGAATALNAGLLIRGLLTLYVIGCTLYILVTSVDWQLLPGFDFRWFPWPQ